MWAKGVGANTVIVNTIACIRNPTNLHVNQTGGTCQEVPCSMWAKGVGANTGIANTIACIRNPTNLHVNQTGGTCREVPCSVWGVAAQPDNCAEQHIYNLQ